VFGALGVAGLLAWWVWRKGIAGASSAAAQAAVTAAGGAVKGAIEAVSGAVGIPGPGETTTDPKVTRWILDNYGFMTASQWSGAPALLVALTMSSGTGQPPPPGTPAYQAMDLARVVDLPGPSGGASGSW
jgi:hypothetical protein